MRAHGRAEAWGVRVGGALLVTILACGALWLGGRSVYAAGAQAPSNARLDGVLRQMDAAGAKFQSAQADLRKQVFTKVVNDTAEQTGMVYFERKGGATQMGMKLTTPPQQVMEYKDGKVRLYNPGTNHLDEVTAAGANKGRFETFLTLGFGGSGKDLEKAWTITDLGSETLNDGAKAVQTEKLDLVSKDPDVKKNVAHATIWVDPARSVSLKQVLYMRNGDTQSATYSNIRLNQPVDTAQFAIKCKGKCS